MRIFVCVCFALTVLGVERLSGATAQAAGPDVKRLAPGYVSDAIASYHIWDLITKQGKGASEAADSGSLGWGESGFLRRYMQCYFVSRDSYWLDKMIDHVDRVFGNLSDPDGDSLRAWSTRTYSVGIVRVKPSGAVGSLAVEPAEQRVYVRRGGEKVTGHTYSIEFDTHKQIVVRDRTAHKVLARKAYKPGLKLTEIPGAKLTVKGTARAGARFVVTTVAPELCEYQVHDGMVTYPIAQFVEAVLTTPALQTRYGAKAREYAATLATHFLDRWERTWTDLPDGAGLYKFTTNRTQRFPETSLPHNQYLALARTWLVLQAVEGLEHRDRYRDRAVRMAWYFKRHLRPNGEAYVWHYWDPLPHEGVRRHVEDISHATIDISFAVEAARRGIVFTNDDLRRFASTYVDVMWNGDKERPRFGSRVDTNKGGKGTWHEWIQLGVADARVWRLALGLYESSGRPATMAPGLMHLYDRLVGVTDAERARCRQLVANCKTAFDTEGVPNAGFELGSPRSRLVPGWQLHTWSPDRGGQARLVEGGHNSKRAVALTGKGPSVNVLASCSLQTCVSGKTTLVLTAFYKTTDAAKPGMAITGAAATGKRLQYSNSTSFPPSADWRQAKWSVALKKGVVSVQILLRNRAPGTVYWDDVAVELK